MRRHLAYVFAWLGLSLIAATAYAIENDPTDRLDAATDILDRTLTLPEQQIPPALLNNAQGLAVIPGVIKAGFIIGGTYGLGALTIRDRDGHWSLPIFLKLVGGSVGWQAGAQSTDVVLVFKTRRSVEGLLHGKFTLGADAAVAAGPIGRRGEAATDAELKAEIVSYSRSRGLFAGVSLEGAQLNVDHGADHSFYGKDVSARDIEEGKVTAPEAAKHFMAAVHKAIGQ
jgi:lipid-binding SYLF domain-containing protein